MFVILSERSVPIEKAFTCSVRLFVYPKLCFYAVYWFVCVYCPERPKKYSRVSNGVQQDSTSFICLSFTPIVLRFLLIYPLSEFLATTKLLEDISFTFSAVEQTIQFYSFAWQFNENFELLGAFKTVLRSKFRSFFWPHSTFYVKNYSMLLDRPWMTKLCIFSAI